MVDRGLLEDIKTSFRLGLLTSPIVLQSTAFAQIGGMTAPMCKGAEALSNVWPFAQVTLTGIIVLGLFFGAGIALSEKKGGWAIILVFGGFVLGAIVWVTMDAIGGGLEKFVNSDTCGGA